MVKITLLQKIMKGNENVCLILSRRETESFVFPLSSAVQQRACFFQKPFFGIEHLLPHAAFANVSVSLSLFCLSVSQPKTRSFRWTTSPPSSSSSSSFLPPKISVGSSSYPSSSSSSSSSLLCRFVERAKEQHVRVEWMSRCWCDGKSNVRLML